jgi:hypothetical protein
VPGLEEPEEPPAEVDVAVRLQAHDRCNPQSDPCFSGAASAVCTVVEEVVQNEIVIVIPLACIEASKPLLSLCY